MDIEIGTDIVQMNEFIEKLRQGHGMTDRIFLEAELRENQSNASLAGVFAAKEAFMKACGKKVDWHDVWIVKLTNGKPKLQSALLNPGDRVKVSISHDGDYAVAFVVIIKKGGVHENLD